MIAMRAVKFLFNFARLAYGCVAYLISGRTPDQGYQGMVGLFCSTRGASNDFLSTLISATKGRVALPSAQGILGDVSGARLEQLRAQLEERGYVVFENILPVEVRDGLLDFALSTPSKVRGGKGKDLAPQFLSIYNRDHPAGVRHDFQIDDVINNNDVQGLMSDFSVLALAQAYLRSKPVADVTNMWWHTAYSDQPDSDAAQFYHFDMDRIRWLKFFFYLTDVGPHSGPHCFVRGSHRTRGIPKELLAKGYARTTDEEVSRLYDEDRLIEFHAPAGTLIVEDTRGLHKGKVVERGDRLMLQIQFSNSLFGGEYPKSIFRNMTPKLEETVRVARDIYVNYL